MAEHVPGSFRSACSDVKLCEAPAPTARVGQLAPSVARTLAGAHRVEAGDAVVITRHGRPIARLSPVEPAKQAVRSLAAFRADRPGWRAASTVLLREARDEAR